MSYKRERQGRADHGRNDPSADAAALAPGKRTLVEAQIGTVQRQVQQPNEAPDAAGIPNSADRTDPWGALDGVQFKAGETAEAFRDVIEGIGAVQRARATDTPTTENVEKRAAAGVSGSGASVPHLAKMEAAFGTSFAGVKAHTGPEAQAACDSIGAHAYATGNSVAFKTAAPSESLVAHELTHVLQQRAGVQGKGGGESASLEAEADSVGSRVAAGESVTDITAKYTNGAAAAKGAGAGMEDERSKPEATEGAGGGAPQMARDETWAGNFVQIDKPRSFGGASFIGNITPAYTAGKSQIGFGYYVRYLYLGDTRGGLDFNGANLVKWGHQMSEGTHFVYSAALPHTKPGTWSAWLYNPGGLVADSMKAEETFGVVNPVAIKKGKARERLVYDFENPIPLQMTGESELKFKLTRAMVKSKRVGVSATGSASAGTSDKASFGVKLALDNDAGSEGGGELGLSVASSTEFKRQWALEGYSSKEMSNASWREETYHPGPKEKGRSKMLVPEYKWVEWDANVWPHNPATLQVTGNQKTSVIGMLIPTGSFEELRSTDPGQQSNSKPTENAEVDPTDTAQNSEMEAGYKASQPQAHGWKTLPGAKWADDGPSVQFMKGPMVIDPAERDYGIQGGHRIHPGTEQESTAQGSTFSVTAEDGLTSSRSEETTQVSTSNVSKGFEGMPGVKGLGQLGASAKFENEESVGMATGTGLSSSAASKATQEIAVSHTIEKTKSNQFVVYTPLYTYKRFTVAWGARKPASGNTVNPETIAQGFVHTFQHTPLPHVKVFNVGRNPKVKLGSQPGPGHVEV